MASSNSSSPLLPFPPDHVFSTGQTMNDFIELAKIVAMMPDATGGGKHELPPALLDPNYIPPNRGPALFAGFFVLTLIAAVAVALRTYSRLRYTPKKLVAEDWIILMAMAVFLVMAGICIWGCLNLQWGYEMYDYTYRSILLTGVVIFIHVMISFVELFLIRIALVLFIRRLYLQTGSRFVYICNTLIVVLILLIIGTLIGNVFQCGTGYKVRANWDLALRVRINCSATGFNWIQSALNTACDTIVMLLPIKVALGMRTKPFWEKVRIWALLGLGVTAWTAAIVRFYYVHVITQRGAVSAVINAMLATHFESSIAIVCSCAPAIKCWVSVVFYGKENNGGSGSDDISPAKGGDQSPNGEVAGPRRQNRMPSLVMYGIDADALSIVISTTEKKDGEKIDVVDLEKQISQFSATRTVSMESDMRGSGNSSGEDVDLEKNLSSSCRPLRTYS